MDRIKHKTREGWLQAATKKLRPVFKKHQSEIPTLLYVGCGWPRGGKAEVIGQCFGKTWTLDGATHIFVSPTQGDAIQVLAVLVHELVHAAVGCEEGHKGKFKTLARALGLEGKLTATTVSEKSILYPILVKISDELGDYPHSRMFPKRKATNPSKKSWVRLYSTTIEDYTLTMSIRVFKEYGYPVDPNGREMVEDSNREQEAA